MNKECNHKKASKEEQESSTKTKHYIEIKQTTQQNSTRVQSPTKQFFTSLHVGIREYV